MAKMEDDIHPRLLDGEVKDKMGSPLMERIKPKFVTPTPPRYNFTAEMSPDLFATNSSISTIPDLNSTMASVMQGDQVTRYGESVMRSPGSCGYSHDMEIPIDTFNAATKIRCSPVVSHMTVTTTTTTHHHHSLPGCAPSLPVATCGLQALAPAPAAATMDFAPCNKGITRISSTPTLGSLCQQMGAADKEPEEQGNQQPRGKRIKLARNPIKGKIGTVGNPVSKVAGGGRWKLTHGADVRPMQEVLRRRKGYTLPSDSEDDDVKGPENFVENLLNLSRLKDMKNETDTKVKPGSKYKNKLDAKSKPDTTKKE